MLWIDAICINQRDSREMDVQIVLMRDIYREAESVCVWLDEGSPEMTQALQTIAAIACYERLADVPIGDSQLTPNGLLCLRALTASEWWQRLWVAQEVLSGHEVVLHSGRLRVGMGLMRSFAVT